MIDPTQTYLSSLLGSYYDHPWTYQDIFELTQRPHRFLFGFGMTSPWQIDMWADPVQPFMSFQAQLFGYVKASPKPVLFIPEEEIDEYGEDLLIKVGSNYYLPIEPELDIIAENGCSTILFQGELNHDQVKAKPAPVSYRSIGLYKDVAYTTEDQEFLQQLFKANSQPFVEKRQANGELFYLRHLATPSFITPRLVEELVEVVAFTRN
jgi:hypothetical protein